MVAEVIFNIYNKAKICVKKFLLVTVQELKNPNSPLHLKDEISFHKKVLVLENASMTGTEQCSTVM